MSDTDVVKAFDERVTVVLDGEDLGVFDSRSPANIDSETGTYTPGGRQRAVATRGQQSRGEGSVTRAVLKNQVARWQRLDRKAGIAPIVVNAQPLDANGDPDGDAEVVRGIFKGVEWSEYDSESSDNRTITIHYQPNVEKG